MGKPMSLLKWLHWAKFSYNLAPHTFTKFTLFKVLYGRDPLLCRLGTCQCQRNATEKGCNCG